MQQISTNKKSQDTEPAFEMDSRFKNGFPENIAIVVFFLLAVFSLAIGTWVVKPSEYVKLEFRKRAELPHLSLRKKEWRKIPTAFESYFNDRFVFRAELLTCRSLLSYFLLHETGSTSVVAGHEGWFYLNGQKNLESFRNLQPYTERELEHLVAGLERQRVWLAQHKIRYLFFIVPGKPTIYPEYLPVRLNKINKESRLDQLLGYLKKYSKIDVVDLRTTLREYKTQNILYYKTDAHWNEFGAFLAYKQIGAYLLQWFPSIHLWELSDFEQVTKKFNQGGLTTMIGLNKILFESAPYLIPQHKRQSVVSKQPQPIGDVHNQSIVIQAYATEVNNPTLPRAVMLRDSMTTALQPFLSEHFRRILYLWQPDFPADKILKENPDIVIQEVVERELMCDLPQTLEEADVNRAAVNK